MYVACTMCVKCDGSKFIVFGKYTYFVSFVSSPVMICVKYFYCTQKYCYLFDTTCCLVYQQFLHEL